MRPCTSACGSVCVCVCLCVRACVPCMHVPRACMHRVLVNQNDIFIILPLYSADIPVEHSHSHHLTMIMCRCSADILVKPRHSHHLTMIMCRCSADKLVELAQQLGTSSWSSVSKHFEGRSSRQCRDRFFSKVHESQSHASCTRFLCV